MKNVNPFSWPWASLCTRMPDDVLLNKGQIIRRCIARIHEEYAGKPTNLENLTKQDSIALNLQRACEAGIDLAMHLVAQRNLGVPQTSRDAFNLLETSGILASKTAKQMRAMVGFRNIAIHEYQQLDTSILQQIIENHLVDFEQFLQECTSAESGRG
jgi:uncharacterized protein YutE (UPF0331/DUF86 family)